MDTHLMRTARITKMGLEIVERPIPSPEPGEALVKTISCGVCEGEVFNYKRVTSTQSEEELFLGHEGSGTVIALGPNTDGVAVGDIVTTSLGGAYGEYFTVPANRLVKLPKEISPRWAVGEAVACCAYSARNARIQKGDKIAVLGCGFMGILCIAFAKKKYGAKEILAVDPIGWRRELALQYGADRVVPPEDPSIPSDCFDVVIEAAGTPSTLDAATRMVAQHGRLTIVGFHQSLNGLHTVDMKTWNLKALEITSGHCRRPLWKREALLEVLPLIADGQVDLQGLISPYAFQDISSAFQDTIDRKEGLMKACILFE